MRKRDMAIAALIAALVFFSGWFIGHSGSNCQCKGACCTQQQNNQSP